MAYTPATTQAADKVLEIIADEVGISKDELCDGSDFGDLGIDDLLARSIIDRIADTLQLTLKPTALWEYRTAEDLKTYVDSLTAASKAGSEKSIAVESLRSVSLDHDKLTKPPKPCVKEDAVTKSPSVGKFVSEPEKSNPTIPLSIILQKTPKTAPRILFLLPDGSGSAIAYARIPPISNNLCLIGMNSPYLSKSSTHHPQNIDHMTSLWTQEIRSRQPHGPYLLGGWSAGGYYSFEVSKRLIHEGETVEKLILIDSPCRLTFEALPMELIHYLARHHLLGDRPQDATPGWLIDHFQGALEAVEAYVPVPMELSWDTTGPEVHIIWATDGVIEDLESVSGEVDLTRKVTRLLLSHRTGFGTQGWEQLFPKETRFEVAKMRGNHFTMVHPPHCEILGNLLRDAISGPIALEE